MEALNLFAGVNLAMIAGIIGVLLGVKLIDRKGVLGKGFFVAAAMLLGFLGAAFVVKPFTIKEWIPSGVAHAGAASILYQFGKLVLPGNDYVIASKNDPGATKPLDPTP
jgi:hypothetical protein